MPVRGTGRHHVVDGVTVRHSRVAHTARTGIGTSSAWGRQPGHPEGPGAAFAPITGPLVPHHTVRGVGGNGAGGVTFRNHLFAGASQGHGAQRGM
ncbi:hypothetical protein ACWHA1_29685 [Streptomyces decoyicus]